MARPCPADEALERAAKVLAAHDYRAQVARSRVLVLTPLFLLLALLVAVLASYDDSWLSGVLWIGSAFVSAMVVGWALLSVAQREIEATEAWQSRVAEAALRRLAFQRGHGVDLTQSEVAVLHQLTDSTWERRVVDSHNRAIARGVSRATTRRVNQ